MARPRRWTTDQLAIAVAHNGTWKQVAQALRITSSSTTLRRATENAGINYGHFKGPGHGRHNPRVPDEELFVEGSLRSHRLLKVRFLETAELRCKECGITEWCGKAAPLQLDHINGIKTDNRRENLRLLCANCHAQTETFSGGNTRRARAARGLLN